MARARIPFGLISVVLTRVFCDLDGVTISPFLALSITITKEVIGLM